jgi:hypothetical protein
MLHALLSHYRRRPQSANNMRRWALVGLAVLSMGIGGNVHAIHLPGNQQLSLTLCDPAATSNPYPHYFHINIFRSGSFEIRMNGAVQTGSFYDTPTLPAGTQCAAPLTVRTANVPNNSTANMINVASCYVINSVPTCTLLPLSSGFANFVVPILPTLTLSPSTSPITQTGSRVITARVTSGTSGERFGLIEVVATCQASNGAMVGVSPVSAMTDLAGEAPFTINAQKLVVPLAGGTPSAVCTFTARDQSGVNTSVKTINYQGVNVDPGISLSPGVNLTAKVSTITATLSSTPAADLSGLFVDVTCATQLATVVPNPASAITNASGVATVTLNASGLVNINPTLSIVPSANCTFKVRSSPGLHQASINYLTANACAITSLLPKPAGCGNP